MPKVEKLNALVGRFVNLPYRLPSGAEVKFLDDETTYLGNQLESEFGGERCFGVLANMDFILVCTYERAGKTRNLCYTKRDKRDLKRAGAACPFFCCAHINQVFLEERYYL